MALDPEYVSMLVQIGTMDDTDDNYPRVCESCDIEYPGSTDKAIEARWRLSSDGWLCKFCID